MVCVNGSERACALAPVRVYMRIVGLKQHAPTMTVLSGVGVGGRSRCGGRRGVTVMSSFLRGLLGVCTLLVVQFSLECRAQATETVVNEAAFRAAFVDESVSKIDVGAAIKLFSTQR